MWYNINFQKLGVLLLPTFLRKPKIIAFIKVLVSPINELHSEFLWHRNQDLLLLNHNGQVCYLRKLLNDLFDRNLRRIQITDGNKYQRQYIYTRSEQKPQFLGKIFLKDRSDYSDTGVDFIVYVPSMVLESNKDKINQWITNLKMATKTYKLIAI